MSKTDRLQTGIQDNKTWTGCIILGSTLRAVPLGGRSSFVCLIREWNYWGWIPQRSSHDVPVAVLNKLRPRQDGCHFADNIFKCIFLNENVWIPMKISMKFVPKGPINNIPTLVQIMAWRRPGDKPLSEPMMISLTTHICITRPQWVKQCCWMGD